MRVYKCDAHIKIYKDCVIYVKSYVHFCFTLTGYYIKKDQSMFEHSPEKIVFKIIICSHKLIWPVIVVENIKIKNKLFTLFIFVVSSQRFRHHTRRP